MAFLILFSIQGCSSSTKSVPPTVAGPADNTSAPLQPASPVSNDVSPITVATTAPAGADLNPATTPAPMTVTFNGGALYSPTRPGTAAAAAIESSAPAGEVTPVATHVVAKGESLSKIANKYHLTRAELAKANGLKASTMLKVGQKLIIPGKASAGGTHAAADYPAAESAASDVVLYKVKPGDSLRLIAKHNGTTMSALRSLNHLKGDNVRVGQQLKLPAGAASAGSTAAAEASPAPSAETSASSKNAGGRVTHVVKSGEKLGAIARKYGVTVGEIATANNISDPSKIRAGQELVIPTASGEKSAPAAAPSTEIAPPPPPAAESANPAPPAVSEPPVIKVDDNAPAAPDAAPSQSQPADNSGPSKAP
ncbi:MAG: LysM peptidoglycan-binding domain-containing protein [Opitutaceae bacterium]